MKRFLLIGLAVLLLIVVGCKPAGEITDTPPYRPPQIDSYEACIAAGFPIIETAPPQCETADGRIFVQGGGKKPIACTKEAKLCPDGSAVGRNGSNGCEFDPCPQLDFPEIKQCILRAEVDYTADLDVADVNDVKTVFNKYIGWAQENDQDIFGYGNNWTFGQASIHGTYKNIKYWKVTASVFSSEEQRWTTKEVFDVSENGEVVRLLGCI